MFKTLPINWSPSRPSPHERIDRESVTLENGAVSFVEKRSLVKKLPSSLNVDPSVFNLDNCILTGTNINPVNPVVISSINVENADSYADMLDKQFNKE